MSTEEKRLSDYRRDSELFEEVSQGLDRIEKGVGKPHHGKITCNLLHFP